jgi:hypothetical protein
MAASKTSTDFLKYAIKNLDKGRDSKISNTDKTFAPYILSKYTTWGEVYDAAVKDFYAQGGTPDDVAKIKNPNYKPPTPGAKPGLTPEAAARDPLGKAINESGLTVSTDNNGDAVLQAFAVGPNGKRSQDLVEHFIYVDTYTDASGKKVNRLNLSADYDEVAKKAIMDYKNDVGGIDNLFESLYKKKLISEQTYKAKNISAPDFKKGLQYTIRQYGISSFDNRQYNQTLTVPNFKTFLGGGSIPNAPAEGTKEDKNLPVRDINLQDRDVVRAMIQDIYFSELQKEVDSEIIDKKTDYYMDQIKSGTLTKIKEGSKEISRTSTAGFSRERLEAELQPKVKKEFTEDYNQAQSINFLSFLSDLGVR